VVGSVKKTYEERYCATGRTFTNSGSPGQGPSSVGSTLEKPVM
jgi:hypothetical protein